MAAILKNILPTELTRAATTLHVQSFLGLYGEALILLVRLRDDATLTAGLGAAPLHGNAGTPVKPILGSLEFETRMDSGLSERRGWSRRPGPADSGLTHLLQKEKHYGVPLRKRKNAEALFPERISIGRAPNKDIVLRHASVSKSHGWFELHDDGIVCLVDGGSKNGSRVNDQRVTPRERVHVVAGDALVFGAVEGILCAPQTLWSALSGRPLDEQ